MNAADRGILATAPRSNLTDAIEDSAFFALAPLQPIPPALRIPNYSFSPLHLNSSSISCSNPSLSFIFVCRNLFHISFAFPFESPPVHRSQVHFLSSFFHVNSYCKYVRSK